MKTLTLFGAALLAAGLPGGASAQYQIIKAFGENVATDGDITGRAVAILGDCDGDGIDDWIVGAPNDGDGGVDSGTAYVLTGGYYSNILFELHGVTGDNLGTCVADAGDWDKDGRGDFIVTAPGADTIFPLFSQDRGAVRVYSGATGTILRSFIGPKTGARMGDAVAGGGDVDADGWRDIICGAPSWDVDLAVSSTSNEGYVAIYSGKLGTLLKTWTGTSGDNLGQAVSFVNELDLDHAWEYAIGSPNYSYVLGGPFPVFVIGGGRVQVYSGAAHTLLYTKNGGSGDHLGSALADVLDTDKDGSRELLVGAPGDGTDGSAYIYEGTAGTLIRTFAAAGYGSPESFGAAVGPLGDVNKDGYPDVAVGAPMTSASVYGGYVHVFSGKDGSLLVPTLNGPYPGVCAGLALSPSSGDLNGDNWPDLLTSWPYADAEGTDSGMAVGLGFLNYQPDLGFEGPGIAQFTMYGTELFSGGQADMKLAYSAANSPAWLMASINQSFSGFKGGILVPDAATALLVSFTTDASGQVIVPGVPGGGGYLIVYCQWLTKNAGYPQGWGISNALAVELLP